MTVTVDAVVNFNVFAAELALCSVDDFRSANKIPITASRDLLSISFSHSTRLLAATTLRNVLGTKNLSDILSEREGISKLIKVLCLMSLRVRYFYFDCQETLDEATDPWGVRVQMVELKDVMLPLQLQRAMAAEAEAAREARAKVIAAEGERDASQSLQEAARVIQKSPQALQVRPG